MAAAFDKTKSFAELRAWLRGTAEQPGRLAEVKKALDKPRAKIFDTTTAVLQAFFDAVKGTGVQLGQIRTTLQQRAGEVSFSQLYKAVSELAQSAVECPACRTPLDRVTVNPFERAEHGMAQLKELSDLQDKAAELKEQLADQAHRLLNAMHSAAIAAKDVAPEAFAAAALPELPAESTGKWMTVWTDDDNRAFNALLKLLGLVETSSKAARDEEARRIPLVQERESAYRTWKDQSPD